MPPVSAYISTKTNPQAVDQIHARVISLASTNNCGNKSPYNLAQGIREHAEDFLRQNKPFGMYSFDGVPVYYVNEHILSEEQKGLIKGAKLSTSGMAGICYLKDGAKVVNISKNTFADVIERIETGD